MGIGKKGGFLTGEAWRSALGRREAHDADGLPPGWEVAETLMVRTDCLPGYRRKERGANLGHPSNALLPAAGAWVSSSRSFGRAWRGGLQQ